MFKDQLPPFLLKLFQTTKEAKTLPNSFCEASIIPYQRKINTTQRKKNGAVSSMNIDAKILKKILVNQIWKPFKIITYYDHI